MNYDEIEILKHHLSLENMENSELVNLDHLYEVNEKNHMFYSAGFTTAFLNQQEESMNEDMNEKFDKWIIKEELQKLRL